MAQYVLKEIWSRCPCLGFDDQSYTLIMYPATGRLTQPHDAIHRAQLCTLLQQRISTNRNTVGRSLQILPCPGDRYLLEIYRYIELNPVRAEMVKDPGEYIWSSYQCNALGASSEVCTPHPEYQAMGANSEERRHNYRSLFSHDVEGKLLKEIRSNTNKGLAIGNNRFREEIESLTGRRVTALKRGRPVGWRKKEI